MLKQLEQPKNGMLYKKSQGAEALKHSQDQDQEASDLQELQPALKKVEHN